MGSLFTRPRRRLRQGGGVHRLRAPLTGDEIWEQWLSVSSDLFLRDMAVDTHGDVFVVGMAAKLSLNDNRNQDFVLKISGVDGTIVWDYNRKGLGDKAGSSWSLVVDGAGDPSTRRSDTAAARATLAAARFHAVRIQANGSTSRKPGTRVKA